MPKNNFISKIKYYYFNDSLDFRAHIFNSLGFLGCALGLVFGVFSLFNYTGIWYVIGNFGAAAAAILIMTVANRTKLFRQFFLITVVVVFLIIFPVLFFGGGGYKSGMPCFFVFAVVFTVLMLEGWQRTVFTLTEFSLYLGCFLTAYFRPGTVSHFTSERSLATDIIFGCMLSSIVIAIAIHSHIKIYDKKQAELKKANDTLKGFSRMKTEFISNTSHEMRTPLTVVSVNVQTATDILEETEINNPEVKKLLTDAQSEVMRLTRMVGGMLALASMSENTDRRLLNLSALLQNSAEMLRLGIQKHGNKLITGIESNLNVFGNADLLSQVIVNLLLNAGKHTENGEIFLTAASVENKITVTVKDTGTGISQEMLPHVFERGVSDGGTGYGLYLCKTIVESHGGRIWIESEPGNGASASFTLPAYEGQLGGEAIL